MQSNEPPDSSPIRGGFVTISSAQNPKLKLARALMTQAKTRRQEGLLVLEGFRLIQDVLAQGFEAEFILHLPEAPIAGLESQAPILPLEPRLFHELSATENSQGVLGVFRQPKTPLPPTASLILAIDGLQDAGNLGTIIRSSAAAGVDGLVLLPNSVDPYNPKCLRAGMGSHFRLPLVHMSWREFENQFSEWQRIGAVVEDHAHPYTADLWQAPTVVVIGNEAHGLSEAARQILTDSVYIPMQNSVESLNSAIAAAILLFEIKRQQGR